MIILGVDPASKTSGLAIVQDGSLLYSASYKTNLGTGYTDCDLSDAIFMFFGELCYLINEYNVEGIIVENTSVNRNLNTTKMLAFFESAALMAASAGAIKSRRIRTTTARKEVCGKGNTKKEIAIEFINNKFNKKFQEDEAEAILFALCNV